MTLGFSLLTLCFRMLHFYGFTTIILNFSLVLRYILYCRCQIEQTVTKFESKEIKLKVKNISSLWTTAITDIFEKQSYVSISEWLPTTHTIIHINSWFSLLPCIKLFTEKWKWGWVSLYKNATTLYMCVTDKQIAILAWQRFVIQIELWPVWVSLHVIFLSSPQGLHYLLS